MQLVIGFFSGALFAIGLALGGMTDPANVVAFLDVFGDWDPSLALVMVGGIATYGLIFTTVKRRRQSPICVETFAVPTRSDFTPRLIIGAGLFGIGWGLSGLCPGPALTSILVTPKMGLFVVAMFVGIALGKLFDSPSAPDSQVA